MNKPKQAILFILISTLFLFAQNPSGRVTSIIDGDTIEILINGQYQRIRLFGIDCPENGQPFSTEATQFTSSLVNGKTVQIMAKDRDSYGRTVAEIILPDGRNLNKEIVKAGYAWWYYQYTDDLDYCAFEARAKINGIGIFSNPYALPPWIYRNVQTSPPSTDYSIETFEEPIVQEQTQDIERIVYITNTGTKYHRAGCRYLSKSMIPISLSDAIARGYTPCSVCKP